MTMPAEEPAPLLASADLPAATDKTELIEVPAQQERLPLRIVAVSGPGAGPSLDLVSGSYVVGKGADCDLVLQDATVSRRHLRVERMGAGVYLEDLDSTNGSFAFDSAFRKLTVAAGTTLRVGNTLLTVQPCPTPLPQLSRFGDLVGSSTAMLRLYERLARVAASDAPVLIHGETGTGKELCAEAIHAHSARSARPLVVVDLAAIPPSLIESELFGHTRGSFTGAHLDRAGAFERADGGTLFLDEVGELSAELQPRLLRAIERGQVKRVGANDYRTVRVRVIAATHRDLPEMCQAGRFRRDLYHRLAVLSVSIPALRERLEDLPALAAHILEKLGHSPTLGSQTMALLLAHDWPGNVRELRNVLERAVSMDPDAQEIPTDLLPSGGPVPGASPAGAQLPFKEAKERLIATFERDYVEKLLARCGGNVSKAAREAGIDRVYLHRLLKRYLPGRSQGSG